MFKFIVCFLIFINTIPVFAGTYTVKSGMSPYSSPFTTTTRINSPTNYNYPQYYNRRPVSRYINNRYPQRYYPNRQYRPYGVNRIPISNLNALERYALNKNYTRENDIQRLERLESLAFGAIQSGDLNSRYQNVESAILSRPQNNYKRSVFGNIANYFAGQPTGYTPSILPNYTPFGGYSSYVPSPGYSTQRFDEFSNGIFGSGYSMLNQNFGNGSSVRILD